MSTAVTARRFGGRYYARLQIPESVKSGSYLILVDMNVDDNMGFEIRSTPGINTVAIGYIHIEQERGQVAAAHEKFDLATKIADALERWENRKIGAEVRKRRRSKLGKCDQKTIPAYRNSRQTHSQLKLKHARAVKFRQEAPFRPTRLDTVSTVQKSYSVFVLLKDVLVTGTILGDGFSVVRLEHGVGHDEVQYAFEFARANLKLNFPTASIDEAVKEAKNGHPICLVQFGNVLVGGDKNDAVQKTLKHTEAIALSLSLLRSGYAKPIAAVAVDNSDRSGVAQTFPTPYTGNLVSEFGGAASIAQQLRDTQKKVRSDKRASLYISLLIEAKREKDPDLKYFRLWSLLEIIAAEEIQGPIFLYDYDGKPVKNSRGVHLQLGSGARDKVFELVRRASGGAVSHSENGRTLKYHTGDLVGAWYQHRNCVAHCGRCDPSNPKICEARSLKHNLCRLTHLTHTSAGQSVRVAYNLLSSLEHKAEMSVRSLMSAS